MEPFIGISLADSPGPQQSQSEMHEGCHPDVGGRVVVAGLSQVLFEFGRARTFDARAIASKGFEAVEHESFQIAPLDLVANSLSQRPKLPHRYPGQRFLKSLQGLPGTLA